MVMVCTLIAVERKESRSLADTGQKVKHVFMNLSGHFSGHHPHPLVCRNDRTGAGLML